MFATAGAIVRTTFFALSADSGCEMGEEMMDDDCLTTMQL